EEWARGRPGLEDYARFRAAGERIGKAWTEWPEAMRDGAIPGEAIDPDALRYHRYVQWIAAEQMDAAARSARAAGSSLYLDLPLGVHPEGYDAWRYRRLFAEGSAAGAPPDAFFTGGQSWGFRPFHPERLREDGYGYLARGLRTAMARAGLARIDHVMAFHRLFWVPEGMRPTDGVYVKYPEDEMYAVLAIEAHRASCAVVGEDLGTVPGEVREEMFRRSLLRMHVLQIEIEGAEGPSPPEAAPWSLASLNTHDMPPFAAFWRGLDLEDRFHLGLCDAEGLRREQARREDVRRTLLRILRGGGWLGEDESEEAVLAGCLEMLSSGPSRLLQINLEDLWLEDRPQNVPGTSSERPNWLRRSRLAVEEILDSRRVRASLERVGALRTRGDVTE
ncbi:MAG TPA: 4-alpha-glucanotransferase, partial [Candidatus Saccharimonadales bacterium]|nr:4-alpha-glucanotransferase [Candidatus Saccharimonadales bacterium]